MTKRKAKKREDEAYAKILYKQNVRNAIELRRACLAKCTRPPWSATIAAHSGHIGTGWYYWPNR